MSEKDLDNIKNLDEEYPIGCLLSFRNLTEQQQDLFIKLISDNYSYLFQVLFNVIDTDTLQLLDIFAGQKIQFPTRKKVYKLLEKIQIYTFIKSKNESPESYKLLAKQYKCRISQIKHIVSRIDYLLAGGSYRELEKTDDI